MNNRIFAGVLFVALGVAAGPAAAQGQRVVVLPAGSYTAATWPVQLLQRPLTLGAGMVQVDGDVVINASTDHFGEPVGIAPDIYFGITDMLTIGVVHGTGICVSGEDNGCPEVYDDVGLDLLAAVSRMGTNELDLHLRLSAGTTDPVGSGLFRRSGFDPLTLTGEVGVKGRLGSPMVALLFDPRLAIGLTERDAAGFAENKEFLLVPVQLQLQALPSLALFVESGINGPLDFDDADFGDTYAIPLGGGVQVTLARQLDLTARWIYPNLLGKDVFEDVPGGPARSDQRWLLATLTFRM